MRYFIEIAYKGTNYAGFQVQNNANTVQAEVEKALAIYLQQKVSLTGSSRTDAGVHALQNFFHFDIEKEIHPHAIYNLNAILPGDIAINAIKQVSPDAHCRFDAISREYKYFLYSRKSPFLADRGWYYPYTIDIELLAAAADILRKHSDFTSFAKRNSQVFTHECTIKKSIWQMENDCLVYNVQANRFLRGMVRGLVGTMLLVGRNKLSLSDFEGVILAKDCTKANFATPAHGLFLVKVEYPFLG
ncbi:tRNA pseudouridine(38-40) synthase TruA [Aridibaculum aurantiacum]|uniref:tRNA pseudouridine(38-40) synthase TruA n=1 Tax=Aridibaculum aurantiacum TaxID=2810307 RepID=UPI001A9688DD|nr:tRNA pseudouridine(38-40) synthase TruA [Aridibaculum aurantiacum]